MSSISTNSLHWTEQVQKANLQQSNILTKCQKLTNLRPASQMQMAREHISSHKSETSVVVVVWIHALLHPHQHLRCMKKPSAAKLANLE